VWEEDKKRKKREKKERRLENNTWRLDDVEHT